MKSKQIAPIISFCVFILFLFSMSSCYWNIERRKEKHAHDKPEGYKGEWDKNYEWVSSKQKYYPNAEQRQYTENHFNHIPDSLEFLTSWLDSSIVAERCFKFIHSPDSTKFIAFFLVSEKDSLYRRVRKYGVTHYREDPVNDQLEFCGFMVWGMKYEGKWYYTREENVIFYDTDEDKAKFNFLYSQLAEELYFKKFEPPFKDFWDHGGRGVEFLPIRVENYLRIYSEFEGKPVIVAQGFHPYVRQTLKPCIQILKNNWDYFKKMDSTLYDVFDTKDFNAQMVSIHLDKVMIGFHHRDIHDNSHTTFIYFELKNDTILKTYQWRQSIETSKTLSGPDIYQYLRTIRPEWSYGDTWLNDPLFWEAEFLKKENGEYIYLKELPLK